MCISNAGTMRCTCSVPVSCYTCSLACARDTFAPCTLQRQRGGGGGIQCGVQGMRRIFQRLGQRLRRANLTAYVSSSFVRAFSNFSAPGNRRQGAYQWGLTGAEAECLFFFVQFSLSGLVSGEISCCRLHAGGSARASPCDPTDDIVRVWSRFASWYMAIKTCRLSDHEVICRR